MSTAIAAARQGSREARPENEFRPPNRLVSRWSIATTANAAMFMTA